MAARLCGQGVALLLELFVVDDIRGGRMRQVLTGFRPPPVSAYLIYPSRRHLPLRARAVIDFWWSKSRVARTSKRIGSAATTVVFAGLALPSQPATE